MKSIEVVAAVIVRGGRIFATQRGYGDFKDFWEFPGGKIEAGESREDALKREIKEELDAEISVDSFLQRANKDCACYRERRPFAASHRPFGCSCGNQFR